MDEEDEDEEEHDNLRYEACIKVTFNHIPKTTFGLQAERSNVAELRLIKLPGVGVLHFALSFDKATFLGASHSATTNRYWKTDVVDC